MKLSRLSEDTNLKRHLDREIADRLFEQANEEAAMNNGSGIDYCTLPKTYAGQQTQVEPGFWMPSWEALAQHIPEWRPHERR